MRKLMLLMGALFFAGAQLIAQQRTVTGKVTDANGIAYPQRFCGHQRNHNGNHHQPGWFLFSPRFKHRKNIGCFLYRAKRPGDKHW